MLVQVNTDNNIRGHQQLERYVEGVVTDELGRFAERLTRVHVHLKDANADKAGNAGNADKHCTMEARPEGLQPIAVTAEADSLEQAVDGAAEKLHRALDTAFGKLADR